MKKLLFLAVLILFSCSAEDPQEQKILVDAYQITLSVECQSGELIKYCTTKNEFERIWEANKAYVAPGSCHKVSMKTVQGATVSGYVRGMLSSNTVCQ